MDLVERLVNTYRQRFSVIDNRLHYVPSFIFGRASLRCTSATTGLSGGEHARGAESRQIYRHATRIFRVVVQYYSLWQEMEQYTSGDGYLAKICMKIVEVDFRYCRPPTSDMRDQFREKAQEIPMSVDTVRVLKGTSASGS